MLLMLLQAGPPRAAGGGRKAEARCHCSSTHNSRRSARGCRCRRRCCLGAGALMAGGLLLNVCSADVCVRVVCCLMMRVGRYSPRSSPSFFFLEACLCCVCGCFEGVSIRSIWGLPSIGVVDLGGTKALPRLAPSNRCCCWASSPMHSRLSSATWNFSRACCVCAVSVHYAPPSTQSGRPETHTATHADSSSTDLTSKQCWPPRRRGGPCSGRRLAC